MTQLGESIVAYAKVVPDCPECGMKMVLEHRGDYTVHCGNPNCFFYYKQFLQPTVKVKMYSLGVI